MTATVDEIYHRLHTAYGPQHWWPAESAFEVMVGAVLVQNTAWKNVERAIDNLRQACLLSPQELYEVSIDELQELIRPAGYFRMKARRLRNLLDYLFDQHAGSLAVMFSHDTETLRQQLLQINGIGPETADSILLYAAEKPVFVVDAYTQRVLKRHGWMEYQADYHEIQEHFQANLPADVELYNEYHALLVRVGHLHCRKTPQCDQCPLADLLPEGGLQEPPSA
ncbi:MAG: endonuclease III domain-containing protein [Planctomycetales bacterium]|nr:endonuclease III domain-containing protein [Planctomycetales bacterium]NIM09188.1 endonuclease III domain-containing protein [Planctomycetales bacterium]NIN08664.1 endonuclease III domain-containing protein [Planctomycetales bacterium]NIN77783.1 endonuclease III domain-containing protein [Planctomycetales bacterium]NIO34960.1 endonuclease III domain-containing protein [Planctomycetales bacterium]